MTMARPGTVDGRSLRRDRNRSSVVDAVLELYRDGVFVPSADDIAARSGISARSIFRYFDDVDDLVRASIARQQERLEPRWALDVTGDEPLDERIDRFVACRLGLIEAMGNVGRVARLRAPLEPVLADELARIRARLRHQVATVFAPELDALAPDGAGVLAACDVMTSWEAYDLLRNDQGLGRRATADAMTGALRRLLGGA
jgi:AcrR family transcriptional regulator